MEQAIQMWGAPTIILIIMGAILVHDKVVTRNQRKCINNTSKENVNLQAILKDLPEQPTHEQLIIALRHSWCKTLPVSVFDAAKETFGTSSKAESWLVSESDLLEGHFPAGVCLGDGGAEKVLALLEQKMAWRKSNKRGT